jgi:hypothetical protein
MKNGFNNNNDNNDIKQIIPIDDVFNTITSDKKDKLKLSENMSNEEKEEMKKKLIKEAMNNKMTMKLVLNWSKSIMDCFNWCFQNNVTIKFNIIEDAILQKKDENQITLSIDGQEDIKGKDFIEVVKRAALIKFKIIEK